MNYVLLAALFEDLLTGGLMKLLRIAIHILIAIIPITAFSVTYEIIANEGGFSPSSLRINRGDTVKWINKGISLHSATSGTDGIANSMFDSGLLSPGVSFEQTLVLPGNINYFDAANTSEQGSITVEDNRIIISPASSFLLNSIAFNIQLFIPQNLPLSSSVSIVLDGSKLFDGTYGSLLSLLGGLSNVPTESNFNVIVVPNNSYTFFPGIHNLRINVTTPGGLHMSDQATYTVIEQAAVIPF